MYLLDAYVKLLVCAESHVLKANEGVDLYMIPGIDMINHSSVAEKRNTTLNRLSENMSVMVIDSDGKEREINFTGFFTMKAGMFTVCSMKNATAFHFTTALSSLGSRFNIPYIQCAGWTMLNVIVLR